MKAFRFWSLGAATVFVVACAVTVPRPPAPPPTPPTPAVRTVAVVVESGGRPIADASCTIDQAPAPRGVSNAAGYIAWDGIAISRRDLQLTCSAEGFAPFSEHRTLTTDQNEDLAPVELASLHVDPAKYSEDQLKAVRGALFTVKACSLPFGPRPGQPDNIVFFASRIYTREQRQCIYDAWRARGYTHGAVGPFIDPGYHGQTEPFDFREDPDAAADLIQEVYDQGFIPVVFITPDHWGRAEGWGDHIWTVSELRTLEPIFKSPRWQKLCRFVVNGWELQGSKYGWSNAKYVEYLTWLRDTFPNAVRALHTIADIEAPVGDGDDTSRPGMSNGECWGRVTPLIHIWLHQSSALFTADHVADNGKTDGENWLLLWDKSFAGSFVNRFGRGNAGWPTTSANGGPLIALPAEYASFITYWQNVPESFGQHWGDEAMKRGAPGYFDGGTVSVPIGGVR